MAWCSHLLPDLKAGVTVQTRPRGNSMTPLVSSGNLCTIEPIAKDFEFKRGQIVLVKVMGSYYLHLVSAVQGDRVQISNNHGRVNGWTNRSNVFGRLTKVEP